MKRTVRVTQLVDVEIDETKFTEEWMAGFSGYMFPCNTVEKRIEHLAQLEARGYLRECFIEGYGPATDMGIRCRALVDEVELLDEEEGFE